jgi:DNA uptake protein ComE-like DNA-binding protein
MIAGKTVANRKYRYLHQTSMKYARLNCNPISIALLMLLFASLSACTTKDNPDEIRRRTAEATETMRRDAKAVAQGVKEGMSSDKTININKASREDLLTLPGINDRYADRIIADRPFAATHDLVTRRVLSPEEYDKIRDRVVADR